MDTNRTTLKVLFVFVLFMLAYQLKAQHNLVLQGVIKDAASQQPVPFATLQLRHQADSGFAGGTVSDGDGTFRLTAKSGHAYVLRISHASYKPVTRVLADTNATSSWVILMHQKSVQLETMTIKGARVKARASGNSTTYRMTHALHQASQTGTDLLSLIPGIQVDLQQNISMAGSSDIMVEVNGQKRSPEFIRQLEASKIDKISLIHAPGPEYDAGISGVIRITLKDPEKGMHGSINAEIPVSGKEVYLFPNYSLQYNSRRYSFHTSYSGEISRFAIDEYDERTFLQANDSKALTTVQHVKQNNWLHRLNAGMDYRPDKRSLWRFYGYYAPYSSEYDGNASMWQGQTSNRLLWKARKADTDLHHRAFGALSFKHRFSAGNSLKCDISQYIRTGFSSTVYTPVADAAVFTAGTTSKQKPLQQTLRIKSDYKHALNENWQTNSGIKMIRQKFSDRENAAFLYLQYIAAGYGSVKYAGEKAQFNAGLRTSWVYNRLEGRFANNALLFLPQLHASYTLNRRHKLSISYRQSVYRPALYQLNPGNYYDDPYALRSGNPELKQERRHKIAVKHAFSAGSNYMALELFYRHVDDAIQPLTMLKDTHTLMTTYDNAGAIDRYGLQWSGALQVGKTLSLQPFLKLFITNTHPNRTAQKTGVASRQSPGLASGLSAVLDMPHAFSASFQLQYNSPQQGIQQEQFSDALYFLTINKGFGERFKCSLKSGLPFSRSFTYHGTRTQGAGFSRITRGNIRMSTVPLWIKLGYRFASGKKAETIQRQATPMEQIQRRDF